MGDILGEFFDQDLLGFLRWESGRSADGKPDAYPWGDDVGGVGEGRIAFDREGFQLGSPSVQLDGGLNVF